MLILRIQVIIHNNELEGAGTIDAYKGTGTKQEYEIAKRIDDVVQDLLTNHAKSNGQNLNMAVKENANLLSTFPSTQTE